MPEINRKGIHVPGGWLAKLPSPQWHDSELEPFIRYYAGKGQHEGVAHKRVVEAWEALWVYAWSFGLMQAITRMARRYAKMHPDLGMRGYDPEKAQVGYVPGDWTGSRGKPAVTEMLRQMGEAQRAKEQREHEDR